MAHSRKTYAVPVLAILAFVAWSPARAWCVDTPGVTGACDLTGPCDGRNTHERIALLAAQSGGNPNGGQNHTIISQWASTPDCEDTGYAHQLKHTSIAGSTSIWTSTNVASALLAGQWVCANKVLGHCVWWRWDPDRPTRARFIGRASHYLADGGQPYHDQVIQSVLYPPGNNFDTWLSIHLAFEAWADAHGNFGVVTNAPTWFSSNPYSTASNVSAATRGLFTILGPLVDLSYNPATQTLTPGSAGICSNDITRACTASAQCGAGTCTSIAALLTGTIVDASWSTIGSGLKGVYRWNTSSSVEPEMVDLFLGVVNDPATGYASTRTPGGQTRIDLARVRSLFMARLMTPAELESHAEDVSWWDAGDTNLVLAHPGRSDPQQTEPLAVINAVGSTSSPIMHPDASLRFLAFSRVHPDPGEPLQITAVVVNEGGAASPAVRVELSVDGQTVSAAVLSPLDPLRAGAVNLSWTATAPGPHELVVSVDPSCIVDESGSAPDPVDPDHFIVVDNREDNVQTHTIYVGPPPEPASSSVQRFDTAAAGSMQLPSGDAQIVLPPNYSPVSPYVSMAEAAPVGRPFPGGAFLSPIYSLNPAGRELDQDVTLTLKFEPCTASAVGVYRFDEGGASAWVPTGNNVVFDVQAGRVTFQASSLGIFAVIGTDVCDDANPCTIDFCSSETCVNTFEAAGVPCGNPTATACDDPDTCDGNGSCLTNGAPNGAACDDGNPCTTGDACSDGICAGTPLASPGETTSLRFTGPLTDKQTMGWNVDPGASVYDVVRGSLARLPVGPGGSDETCLDDDLASTSIVDPATPGTEAGFWYLVRGKSPCGVGTYGREGLRGAAAAERRSATCQPYCGAGELCFVGQRCVNGACVCDAVSCPSGCCAGATCTPPTPSVCGSGGGACVACGAAADTCVGGACRCGAGPACGTGQRCVSGTCVCDAVSCPNGCCAGATCTAPSPSACGSGGGACVACGAGADACVGGVCQCGAGPACGAGQRCVNAACVCDAVSCPNGCCAGATCTAPSPSACGGGGGACVACGAGADACVGGVCQCGASPACGVGQRCMSGVCVCDAVSCPNGCCAGATCTPPTPSACGSGGSACVACGTGADTCVGGICQCGAGPACGVGQRCVSGICVCDAVSCPNGCCAGATCTPPTPSACGSGGGACVACSSNHVGNRACTSGICTGACDAGWGNCDGNLASNGCETSLFTDPDNCGSCTSVCSSNHVSIRACASGTCTGTCSNGWGNCDGNMRSNGCETHTDTDPDNCGSCTSACSPNHVYVRACALGECTGTCDAGWGNCDGVMRPNGCESNLYTDLNNCGSCALYCSSNHVLNRACTSGTCTGTCEAGWGDCDGNMASNGCETDVMDDPNNCGVCGLPCGGGKICESGSCICPPGLYYCASSSACIPNCAGCGGAGFACAGSGSCVSSCKTSCAGSANCTATAACVAGCPMCPPAVQTCTTPPDNRCLAACNPSTCPGGECH